MMSLYKVTTVNGHLLPEVVSALQKCIRRGQVDDALYWAVDMYLTGYDEYCWKRLRIMASEDVGPAEPNSAGHDRRPIRIRTRTSRRRRTRPTPRNVSSSSTPSSSWRRPARAASWITP